MLQFLAFALTGRFKWFGLLWMTVCLLYGFASAELFAFTGNMITLSQILSLRTGVNVMGSYVLAPVPFVLSSGVLYVCSVCALLRIRRKVRRRLPARLLALCLAALALLLPAQVYRTAHATTYKDNCLREYGIPMELLLEYKSYRVNPPENYSAEAVEGLRQYAIADVTEETDAKPHVIAIMIEAFSDLSVLGDFETDVDPLTFTRTLWSESIHGNYLASTLAGGTSRTEWEFLTGNSMHFIPADSIPFRQYVGDSACSIVDLFRNEGYHTIGMHPFDRSGWDRYRVYPAMGFDEIYFENDLEWDSRVRGYVSDSAFVHQVIRLFESRSEDAPMFLFGVTMQNHGGYAVEGFDPIVHIEGLNIDCREEEQYLSLVKLTDDALKELINYFRGVDEDVEIVLFGDHQPGLTRRFYEKLRVKDASLKYIVPYVIWKNHDGIEEETDLTSANLLPVRMLREAGLSLPPYYRFLERFGETIPAICGLAYQYEGQYYPRGSAANEQVGALLQEYAIYQYGNMFDESVDSALFTDASAGKP